MSEFNDFNAFNVMGEHGAQAMTQRHILMARGTHRGQVARTRDKTAWNEMSEQDAYTVGWRHTQRRASGTPLSTLNAFNSFI